MATATNADQALSQASELLVDVTAPLDARIRALYQVKEAGKTIEGARLLLKAVDTTDSVLLQHELIYNVGQFGFKETMQDLERIVADQKYDVVSRHEAIEAIGAIGEEDAIPFLKRYAEAAEGVDDDAAGATCVSAPIKESAILAICRIQMKLCSGAASLMPPSGCPFVSVDPSPAFEETKSLEELERILNDASGGTAGLWDRYRAMFSLRNEASKNQEAAIILGKALRHDSSSCLFRHEIAFVLGQVEHPASEPYLCEALMDEQEHPMVRHEAAEAIGALAEKHSWDLLERYATHKEGIVRDSCVVALEMFKYWSQYKPNSIAAE